jgi:hypothetical protein
MYQDDKPRGCFSVGNITGSTVRTESLCDERILRRKSIRFGRASPKLVLSGAVKMVFSTLAMAGTARHMKDSIGRRSIIEESEATSKQI